MINFRYHLVSIAAVLIALAAGIALGSGPLDRAGSSLRGDEAGASRSTDAALSGFEAAYVGQTSGSLLKGALTGQSVVVLTAPGASAVEVKDITADLGEAGAEVTGEIALTAKLLDSSGRQFAEGVAQQAGSDVPGVTAAGDSYGRIGAALGRSILADTTTNIDPTASTIRSAFTEGDLLNLTKPPKKLATLAVLVTGQQRPDGAGQSEVLAALAGALNSTGKGVVVAGPSSSSTDGGPVKAVRDSESAPEVSTVDVTNTPAGRVLTVLAVARQAAGQPGAWGTSRSADGALPAAAR